MSDATCLPFGEDSPCGHIVIEFRDGTSVTARVGEEDYAELAAVTWHLAGGTGSGWYAFNAELGYMHRWVARRMGILDDMTPKGREVDHQNADVLDNRRRNLRVLAHADNARNPANKLRKNNKSGYAGVYYVKARAKSSTARRWAAQVTVNRRTIPLGHYHTAEEAAAARQAWYDANNGGVLAS